MADDKSSRIKYALHSTSWDQQDPRALIASAGRVLASEYTDAMHGHLYCPGCYTGLTRTPRDKLLFSNGRRACFAHLPGNRDVPCDLRSKRPEGKQYLTEEDAAKAIEDHQLVVVSGFLTDKPEAPESVGVYDQTPVEDVQGPVADIPIARHHGRTFRLPTRIATVAGICRRFDDNLYRYYVFPGANHAVRLVDALIDGATVTALDETPRLYFARIKSSFVPAKNPSFNSIRMTRLHHHPGGPDFTLKLQDHKQREKGIDDESLGRIVLFWGAIVSNGTGLAVERLSWGEFALLPQKYESLLEDR